ncbi:MAG: hypothetical protein ABW061_13660 [Polyangiaceae bacterium]
MRELRAARFAAVAALCVLAPVRRSQAEAAPRVVVISTVAPDARLARVLRLISGELAGLGLDAELREEPSLATAAAPSGAYGTLVIEASDASITVRAYAPDDPKPVLETIDLDSAGVNAEVVAVRAVETLRAALLPFAQAHRAELSPAARDFARLPEAPKTKPTPPVTPPPAAARGQRRTTTPVVELAVGPTLLLNAYGPPSFNAQAALLLGPSWGFVALAAESSLNRAQLSGRGGHAEVARQLLSVQLGARLRVRKSWELSSRVGVGYLSYSVRGVAEPGYVAQDLTHHTAAGALALSSAYYFAQSLGVYLSVSGQVGFDAARVRVAQRDVGTLDQPSLEIGAGALVGVF